LKTLAMSPPTPMKPKGKKDEEKTPQRAFPRWTPELEKGLRPDLDPKFRLRSQDQIWVHPRAKALDRHQRCPIQQRRRRRVSE